MKKMSIKEYAIAHKLSIYNVVKMTKNGTLPTETVKVDGKDEVLILQGDAEVHSPLPNAAAEEQIEDYEKAYVALKSKYDRLKREFEKLQHAAQRPK